MPLRMATGFEFGLNSSGSWALGADTARFADQVAGGSIITTSPRSGTYCYRINQTASAGSLRWHSNATSTIPATQNRIVFNAWIRFPTSLPAADCTILTVAATVRITLQFRNSDDSLIMNDGTTSQTGPVVAADTWYHVEFYTDLSANPWITKWRVDGTGYTDLSTASAATSITSTALGNTAVVQTMVCDYDDVAIWTDSAAISAYPYGPQSVKLLIPDTGGTTAQIGTPDATSRFTANATPDATHNSAQILSAISELPPAPGAAATGVAQRTAGATNAVGIPMTSYTLAGGESISGVRILVCGWSGSGTANNVALRTFNGTTETSLFAAADPIFDASTTAPGWLCKMATPAEFDTQAELNALVVRYGYSTDISPFPGAHAIYAEVAITEAAGAGTTPVTSTLATTWRVREAITKTVAESWPVETTVNQNVAQTWRVRQNISALTDDFSTINTGVWSADAGIASVGGQLQITPTGFEALSSLGVYDLTGSECLVEVIQIADSITTPGTASDTWFELRIDDSNRLRVNVASSGVISFYRDVGGSGAGADFLWNATDMRWWRFREAAGTVYWDTSPNGSTSWTNRYSVATPINITALQVRIRAYSSDATPAPAIFDNLNIAGATTPVSTSVATTWNTRQSVTPTTAQTWRVRQEITKTVAQSWPVETIISQTIAQSWRVRQAITPTVAQAWKVVGQATQTVAESWRVRQNITPTIAEAWRVRQAVEQTTASSWRVRTPVTANTVNAWKLAERVTTSTAQAWPIRSVVTQSTVQAWAAKTLATASATETWRVRAPATASLVALWNVAGAALPTVTTSLTTTWHARGAIAASSAQTWAVKTITTQTVAESWRVRAAVTSLTAETWNLRTVATSSTAQSWTVKITAAQTVAESWRVRQATTSSSAQLWNVAGLLITVTNSLATSWHVVGRITISSTQTWAVRAALAQTVAESWRVRQAIAKTAAETWHVRTTATPTTAQAWTVRSGLTQTAATSWRLRQAVTTPAVQAWNVYATGSVSTSQALSWRVRTAVSVPVAETWAVRTNLTSSSAQTWAVRITATRTVAETWNVLALLAVTSSHTTLWRVRAWVSPTLAETWHVRTRTTESLSEAWQVRRVATATTVHSWAVKGHPTTLLVTLWRLDGRITTTHPTSWKVQPATFYPGGPWDNTHTGNGWTTTPGPRPTLIPAGQGWAATMQPSTAHGNTTPAWSATIEG